MSLLAALVVLYGIRFQPALAQCLSKLAGVCALVVLTLSLGLLLSGLFVGTLIGLLGFSMWMS